MEEEMSRARSTQDGEEECIQGFGGKTRKPLRMPIHRWQDNIKMDLRET
jgi:hypothetical protein